MPRIIDKSGRKMCQKKHKDVIYKLLWEFFQKYFVLQQKWAVKNSFSTNVCYAPDDLFWLNLYHVKVFPKYFILGPIRTTAGNTVIGITKPPPKIDFRPSSFKMDLKYNFQGFESVQISVMNGALTTKMWKIKKTLF